MGKIRFLVIIAVLMSLFSCAAELNDPVVNSSTTRVLEAEYNAKLIESNNSMVYNLPELTLKEAETILSELRNHVNADEELEIQTAVLGDMQKWQVVMTHTINQKYIFTIQLNLTSYDDGSLFYNGYSNSCTLDEMKWQVGGFSFSSKGDSNHFKFESQSYLYLKIAGDEEPLCYLVPVSILGQYNPNNHEASFTYSL